MEALLSPHSATALIFQPQGAFLWDGEKLSESLPPAEVAAWLAAHDELRWHSSDSIADVGQALSLYNRRQEALDLALIGLDKDFSELRDEAQEELETLLADAAVARWLADLFHVRPLPSTAEVAEALAQARAGGRKRLLARLEPVVRRQSAIESSWTAWSAMSDELTKAAGGRQALLDAALEQGLFARTVGLLAEGKSDAAKFEALTLLKDVPGHRQIVEAWLSPLAATEPKCGREDSFGITTHFLNMVVPVMFFPDSLADRSNIPIIASDSNEIPKELSQHVRDSQVAGYVLYAMVDRGFTLDEAVRSAKLASGYEERQIYSAWDRFRPVTPLWCAWAVMMASRPVELPTMFPATDEETLQFAKTTRWFFDRSGFTDLLVEGWDIMAFCRNLPAAQKGFKRPASKQRKWLSDHLAQAA